MEKALVVATSLFLLVLALNDVSRPWRTGSLILPGGERYPATLEVTIAAKGHLLPSGVLGGGTEHFEDMIRLGEVLLTTPQEQAGLRTAWLAPDFSLHEYRSFDVASSLEETRELAQRCELAPLGSVVALASARRTAPLESDDAGWTEELRDLAARLGSRVRPFEVTPCSWALLSMRVPGGWHRLAEAFSLETGVVLPFVLDRGRGMYADHEAVTFFDGIDERAEILLYRERDAARVEGAPLQSIAVASPNGGFVPAIQVLLAGTGEPEFGRIAWSDVPLGSAPEFHTGLAIRSLRPSKDPIEATFELWVDGRVEGRRLVQAAETATFSLPWHVDLAAHAGRKVDVELRIEAPANLRTRNALWERPVLSFGSMR